MIEKPAYEELEMRVQELTDSITNMNIELKDERIKRKVAENKLYSHLQNTPVGVVSLDLNLNVTDWNPAAEIIFGYTKQEACGEDVTALIVPEDVKSSVKAVILDLLSGRGSKRNTNENITKSGDRIICDWFNAVLYDADGKITGIAFLVNDVTKEKVREKQLLRFATVIDQADEEVVITDIQGIIQYVNPSFERNLGYNKEQVIGKTPSILKSGLHDAAFYKDLWRTILKKKIWRGLIKNQCRDGSILLHDMVITPILDSSHDISAFVSIRRDITKQKDMEQQLQQSHKMEGIGTLAGGIAHDFNNILSGIFGYAQLAEMNLDNPAKAQANIRQITKGAKRATDLVQQILTFSRQTEHKKNPFKLYLIIKEAIKFLRSSIPATIEIKTNISSRSLILADPTQMHQIIMNLSTNAYHSMRETGGVLTISPEDCGYRVLTFSNGEQAFDEFKKDPYQIDLMITDMTMPNMTGDELSCRALEMRNELPIILCTGYSDNISEIKALEIGIKKYLQKPIDSQNLLFLIRSVLDEQLKHAGL